MWLFFPLPSLLLTITCGVPVYLSYKYQSDKELNPFGAAGAAADGADIPTKASTVGTTASASTVEKVRSSTQSQVDTPELSLSGRRHPLLHVLESEKGYQAFKDFLVKEFSAESLFFWKECQFYNQVVKDLIEIEPSLHAHKSFFKSSTSDTLGTLGAVPEEKKLDDDNLEDRAKLALMLGSHPEDMDAERVGEDGRELVVQINPMQHASLIGVEPGDLKDEPIPLQLEVLTDGKEISIGVPSSISATPLSNGSGGQQQQKTPHMIRREYYVQSKKKVIARAIKIYKKYIHHLAPSAINIAGQLRDRIREHVVALNPATPLRELQLIFKEAEREVLVMMEDDAYLRFLYQDRAME